MYYKQSTKNIKLVIMSFDDVMFDLTRLRYNYYRRLCKLYNETLDKKNFLNHQGSVRTMFANCPIDSALLSQENMVHKIETDLLAYCQMYGLKHRDGLVELMELFRQKKIPCIVTSTHPQSYTEPLFKLAALYHQPTEIIYDNESLPCLPDPTYYQMILTKYQVDPTEVLLIASHKQAVYAANLLRMNVIAVPGLEEPSKEMEIRCLKVVTSLLEIINIILEGRMALLSDQYLLIRYDGGTQDLYHNYQHLRDVYRNDQSTLETIETIYQDEFSRAQKENLEMQLQKQATVTPFQSDVSVLNSLEDALNNEEKEIISTINEALAQKQDEITAQNDDDAIIHTPNEEKLPTAVNPLEDMQDIDPSLTLDSLSQDEVSEPLPDDSLAKMINEVTQTDIPKINDTMTKTKIFSKEELKLLGIKEEDLSDGSEEDEDDITNNEETPSLITSFFVNIGYALMDAILVALFGGVLMVGFHDWLSDTASPFHLIATLLDHFGDTAINLFNPLVSSLTAFFKTSEMFNGLLSVILLLSLVIWIVLDIVSIIKKIRSK